MSEDVLERAANWPPQETYEVPRWYLVGAERLIDELATALREARKDTERLDWVLDNHHEYRALMGRIVGRAVERRHIDAAAKSAKGER